MVSRLRFRFVLFLFGLVPALSSLALIACGGSAFAPQEAFAPIEASPQPPQVSATTADVEPTRSPSPATPASPGQAPWWLERLPEAHWGAAAAWGQDEMAEVYTDLDEQHTLQVFLEIRGAAAAPIDQRLQLTHGPQLKLEPAIVFDPVAASFTVLYGQELAPGRNEIRAVSVSKAGPQAAWNVSDHIVVATPQDDPRATWQRLSSFTTPRAVWVDSQRQVFAVFHTDTAVHAAWIKSDAGNAPAAGPAFALIDDRAARVSSPTVAYAAASDRLLVAWGIMGSQENIELGVMAPTDDRLSLPARDTWAHKQGECNHDMAPACVEGGDRPALAYNAALHKFGLAIADDLNDGSRLEGFLIDETCSSAACPIDKVGHDDDAALPVNQRERSLATMDRIASVAIAPASMGFVVGFAFGQGGPSAPDRLGLLAFDATGPVGAAPTPIVEAAGAQVALGSAGVVSAPAGDHQQALLVFRKRDGTDAHASVGNHVVSIDLQEMIGSAL